jgi:hypothetical protein
MLYRPSSFRKSAIALTTVAAFSAASLFPAQAQTVLAANPPASDQVPAVLRAIPHDQCKYVADRFAETLQKHGKDFVSDETRTAVLRFLVSDREKKALDCAGPREIPWVKGKDFDFVMALGDLTSDAYKPVDFRIDYGFKPAKQPVASAATRQRSELKAAPGS